jgi:hypothetical protein
MRLQFFLAPVATLVICSSCSKEPAIVYATPYDVAGTYDCRVEYSRQAETIDSTTGGIVREISNAEYSTEVEATALNESFVQIFGESMPYPVHDWYTVGKSYKTANGDSLTQYSITFFPRKDSLGIHQIDAVSNGVYLNGVLLENRGGRRYSCKLRQ